VFVNARAAVTAGFANEVEAVNQYAAVIYAATAKGTAEDLLREHPQTTASSPNVATASLNPCAAPLRAWVEKAYVGSLNIASAIPTPAKAPRN
jgi:hypothetical protein